VSSCRDTIAASDCYSSSGGRHHQPVSSCYYILYSIVANWFDVVMAIITVLTAGWILNSHFPDKMEFGMVRKVSSLRQTCIAV
jgi:hypothetical protein